MQIIINIFPYKGRIKKGQPPLLIELGGQALKFLPLVFRLNRYLSYLDFVECIRTFSAILREYRDCNVVLYTYIPFNVTLIYLAFI